MQSAEGVTQADAWKHLRTLGELARAASSAMDPDAFLHKIITAAVEMSGGDQGTIYDFDETSREFLPRAWHGMAQDHL